MSRLEVRQGSIVGRGLGRGSEIAEAAVACYAYDTPDAWLQFLLPIDASDHRCLVGGFKHVLLSIIYGIILPID